MSKFKGLVALVTGGAGHLGKATVIRLAKRGAKVVCCDLPEKEESFKNSELGDNVMFCPTDVTRESEVQQALDVVKATHSNLDVVVNCAGSAYALVTYNKNRGDPHEQQEFLDMLMLNTVGTFNVCRLAAQMMSNQQPLEDSGQRGVIINTSSHTAQEGNIGQVAYAASKAAVSAMTLPLCRDLGNYGIRVNTISPGLMDTPLLGPNLPNWARGFLSGTVQFPKRFGLPEEFAHLVQFIIENPYVNGETIRLDGGRREPNPKH